MCLRAPFLLACLCLLLSTATSQKAESLSHRCGVTTSIQEASQKEGYQKKLSNYKKRLATIVSKQLKNNTDTTIPCPNGITIIPIAFHLFHEPRAAIGKEHNFSLSDLNLVVDYLNMHFSGVNPRKSILGDQFSNFDAGNTCIQFTIGKINRIDTETCEHWDKNVTQYQLHKCLPGGSGEGSENDPNDFLNLYVTQLHGGLLGQASNIPGIMGKSNNASDGVTISRNIIVPGAGNKTLYDKGGILAHEIGHWLGLAHVDGDIQGSGCEGDDGIEDTYPQANKNTYVCSEAVPQSCGTPDNVFNFMDYSMDCAKLMFTKQQAAIMHDVLNNDRKKISRSYYRMDKSSPIYDLETEKASSTPIEWVKIKCQERINLLEFQKKWTKRLVSQQSITGTKNYYWEKSVSASSAAQNLILDERYLSEYNALSGLSELKGNSVVILRLKEQNWNTTNESYEAPKTRGIILVVLTPCPSPVNDKISNAIVLNQGTLCNEDSYSLLYAKNESDKKAGNAISEDNDIWFKMNTNIHHEMIELIIKRPNSDAVNPTLEVYNLKMEPLQVSSVEDEKETHYYIEKSEGVSDIFIRAFDADESIADPFQICRMGNSDINDNCESAYQVSVLKYCEWLGYSFRGSSPSSQAQAGYNCGANREFYDVWFETVVPASGYFSVKCKNKEGGKNDILLEVYSGTCNKKELLGCQMVYGISANDPMAYLPFVGMQPGQKIFIRVGARGYGQQGDFDLCVSQSFKNICTITKIAVSDNVNCNAASKTYSQEITVSYQSTGALNKLIVNGQYFTLMENPQTIILRDLPANKPLTITAHLLNLEDPTCWSNSGYTIEAIDPQELPCQEKAKENDICLDAISIDIACSDITYSLDKSGSSNYSSVDGCIIDLKDEWFELIVPSSGTLSIEIPQLPNTSNLIAELYQGDCEDMAYIGCIQKDDNGISRKILEKLMPGDIVYLRVADLTDEFQGAFSLCISEPQLAEFRTATEHTSTVDAVLNESITDEITIDCYPNPSIDYVNLSISNFDRKLINRLSLIDSNGRIISNLEIISSEQKLDLTSVQSGLYLLKIQMGAQLITKRLVKA